MTDAAIAAHVIVSALAADAVSAADRPSPARSSRRAARLERIATGPQQTHVDPESAAVTEPVLLDDVVPEVDAVIDVVPAVDVPTAIAADEPLAEHLVEPVLTPAEPFEMLSPGDEAEDTPSASAAEAEPEASGVDEFEAAARLFSFTGETPVQSDASATSDEPSGESAQTPHVAPRRARRGSAFRRISTASFSIGVFGIVGLLAVGMTTPAAAVAAIGAGDGTPATTNLTAKTSEVVTASGSVSVDSSEIQAYVTPSDIQSGTLDRTESYVTASMAEVASDFAIARPSDFYVNDMSAAIQWPFAVGVAITWGFVMRDGRMHNGADFVPGEGAHVQAIADGTVRIATESGGGFGVTVLIDHVIDGELVSSRYAHMLNGSLQVKAGDTVKVGQYLGRTGNTGHSFGAHTHFEILAGGTTPIDPIAWLRQNAGRDSLG
ncbi:Peptidase family M23 [Microbacterium sp. RU33B]|nr:Peptidase family M23 [Microbacterium sp. RU33B]